MTEEATTTQPRNELVVIAESPAEMAQAQRTLIRHVQEQLDIAVAEHERAAATIEQAEALKIDAAPLRAILRRQESRRLYLNKVAQALEAGYVIVPNFEGTTIAIRVKEGRQPKDKEVDTSWKSSANLSPQTGDILPAGEGVYVDPLPTQMVETYQKVTDPKTMKEETRYLVSPVEFDEHIEMPIEFLKPRVIEMTGICMARKIFDEVAIAPRWRRKKDDPLVLGRIIDRRNDKTLTFLIAWFLEGSAI